MKQMNQKNQRKKVKDVVDKTEIKGKFFIYFFLFLIEIYNQK